MKPMRWQVLILGLAVCLCARVQAADIFDIFDIKPATNAPRTGVAGLSQQQIAAGLKEALGQGVEQAVTTLGKTNGFLMDAAVKILMPEGLRNVESALRALRQDQLADEFVTAMNRAAEQAVPEAAGVLVDSVKQMTISDAASILTSTNNSATEYFRRTSETNLYTHFLPIVKDATAKAGVTSAYKRMTERVTGGSGQLGGIFGIQAPDLDDYITKKALDGLFLKIGEQEKLIRENPVARTSEILERVFGAIGRQRESSRTSAP